MSAETTSILDRFAWTAWRRQPQITVGHFPYAPLCKSCRRHPISDRFSKSRLCRPCRRAAYDHRRNRHPEVKARKRTWLREERLRERQAAGV